MNNDIDADPSDTLTIFEHDPQTRQFLVPLRSHPTNPDLDDVNEAFRLLEDREVFGKVVVKP